MGCLVELGVAAVPVLDLQPLPQMEADALEDERFHRGH